MSMNSMIFAFILNDRVFDEATNIMMNNQFKHGNGKSLIGFGWLFGVDRAIDRFVG